MNCSTIKRLAGGFVAVLAVTAAPAAANEMANPSGSSYYGYGGSSFGYGGVDAMPQFTSYAGYGGFPYGYSGYGPNYGVAGYGNLGYGYGYGGYASGGNACGGNGYGRRHHCSFGNNCPCCNNVWDGYCGGGSYGGGCAGPVKVHRRHRPLGCGAGPCVDASCGAYNGRPHRCHRRWQQGYGCGPTGCDGGYAPAGMTIESAPVPNAQPSPAGTEQLEPPMPGIDSEAPPSPEPADNSST